METLASYSLSDLLLFSDRVYGRMFLLHNEAWWPLQIVTLLAGLVVLWAIARPARVTVRIAYGLLAIVWAFVAWAFFWERYATINWAAPYLTPAFLLQAVLLAGFAVFGVPRRSVGPAIRAVALLAGAVALVGYPMITGFGPQSWRGAEVFGLAPDPTVVLTIALLAVTSGAISRLALLIPVLWIVATGLTLWTLEADWALLAPSITLVLLLVRSVSLAAGRARRA